jgi:hypothetical protein
MKSGERARDLEHALLTVRQRACAIVRTGAEADEIQQVPGFLAEATGVADEQVLPERRVLVDVEAGHHVLEERELLEEADLLERARDAEPHARVGRHAFQLMLVEHQFAIIWLIDAREQVQHGRLAGAVRSDQRVDRLLRHGQRHVAHRVHAAKALADVICA